MAQAQLEPRLTDANVHDLFATHDAPGRLASKHEAVGRSQSRGVTQIELCFERKMLTEV